MGDNMDKELEDLRMHFNKLLKEVYHYKKEEMKKMTGLDIDLFFKRDPEYLKPRPIYGCANLSSFGGLKKESIISDFKHEEIDTEITELISKIKYKHNIYESLKNKGLLDDNGNFTTKTVRDK